MSDPQPDAIDAADERARREAAALLRGLNDDQRAGVTSDATTLRILAGAGSGKTRVLTHRIAYRAATGAADPARVLAVTFTRKAAAELRQRLGRLGLRDGVQAGTFHAIAWAQLRQRWEERGIRRPEMLDRKVGFVARLCPGRDRTLPLDVVSEIEWASARLVEPEDYPRAAAAAHRRPPVDHATVAEIYGRYQEAKKRRRLVDFDDLLKLAARDLEADPVYATARRWRFRHVYVDEFQDVNPSQHRLLSAWLGPESTLCAVGDPNQAIYAWNGADARYLVDFETFHRGAESVTLRDNYRSTPEILAAANAVLAAGGSRVVPMRPNRPPGPRPTIRSFEDETAEARGVARACRDHHRPGDPWGAQAVLVRTNAQAAVLSEAFVGAGIPHKVRGAGSLLEQPEVKEALSELRRANSVADFLADCERTARLGEDLLGTAPGDTGADGDGRRATGPGAGPYAAAPDVRRPATTGPGTGPPDTAAPSPDQGAGPPSAPGLTEERRANIAELVRLGREYLALDPNGGAAEFGAWLRATLRDTHRSGDAVEIATFHAAKGLEWPIVHVAGLEKGYVPIHHTEEDPEAVEEERRLLYVALTRARDELHCSHAARRAFGSRSLRRQPSPWLEDLRAGLGPRPRRGASPDTAQRMARARAGLRDRAVVQGDDQEVFEALRAWRRGQAKAAGVPAYVVFNDATLRAIAAERPTTPAQLLALPGIGAVKVERFGPDLLRIVAEADD